MIENRTVAFHTLGCKVNQYDTQAMRERFEEAGFRTVDFEDRADVYVVNTCTVTGTGDKKSMQTIRRCHRLNPDAAIVVTGCLAQRAADELKLPGVRLVLGTQRRGEVVQLLFQALEQDCALIAVETLRQAPFERLTVHAHEGHTRATMKIQEGCDRWCTYCIIPSVRGPIRSRPLDEIRAEAESLAAAGFREAVLTGIHLTSYGRDFRDGTTLIDLLELIAREGGEMRIRLGSLEPRTVTREFCERAKKLPTLCPHFHLSMQSGCDATLKRMNRKYDTARYYESVELLREYFDDPAITTDLITGFPEETEEEFGETLAFIEKCGFAAMHIFPYSIRPGTKAAAMAQVDMSVREERAARAAAVAERMHQGYLARCVGKTFPVLFEQDRGEGSVGHAPNYMPVTVDVKGLHNTVQNVRITAVDGDGLRGEPEET